MPQNINTNITAYNGTDRCLLSAFHDYLHWRSQLSASSSIPPMDIDVQIITNKYLGLVVYSARQRKADKEIDGWFSANVKHFIEDFEYIKQLSNYDKQVKLNRDLVDQWINRLSKLEYISSRTQVLAAKSLQNQDIRNIGIGVVALITLPFMLYGLYRNSDSIKLSVFGIFNSSISSANTVSDVRRTFESGSIATNFPSQAGLFNSLLNNIPMWSSLISNISTNTPVANSLDEQMLDEQIDELIQITTEYCTLEQKIDELVNETEKSLIGSTIDAEKCTNQKINFIK